MCLRHKLAAKDGKEQPLLEHVEEPWVSGGRTGSGIVLYLARSTTASATPGADASRGCLDEAGQIRQTDRLFHEDSCAPPLVLEWACPAQRPAASPATAMGWLLAACHLWDQLQLDDLVAALPASRRDTRVNVTEDAGG